MQIVYRTPFIKQGLYKSPFPVYAAAGLLLYRSSRLATVSARPYTSAKDTVARGLAQRVIHLHPRFALAAYEACDVSMDLEVFV